MPEVHIRYDLDSRPPIFETLLFGLHWLAITVATVIIIGKVVAGLHFDDFSRQRKGISLLFLGDAAAIPFFYLDLYR